MTPKPKNVRPLGFEILKGLVRDIQEPIAFQFRTYNMIKNA